MYSIIIPAYNEEDRIKDVLSGYAEKFTLDELIVICDGHDGTADVVRDISQRHSNVRLLAFKNRLGKGGALIKGFKAATGDTIAFVDADESVALDDFAAMVSALNGSDGMIASRRLGDSKILVKQPVNRRIASRVFNLLVRMLFGLPFKDTQCGAKIFKRDAIYSILDDLETRGFETDVEILWRLHTRGYRIKEYPITWRHSEGSKLRLTQSQGMLLSLLKIWFKGKLYPPTDAGS